MSSVVLVAVMDANVRPPGAQRKDGACAAGTLSTRARTGPLVEPEHMAFLENVAALLTTNPQSPAWVERVKACLGDRFRPCLPVWCSRNVELDDNHRLVGERLWELLPHHRGSAHCR
jgi:hypothetical protein